ILVMYSNLPVLIQSLNPKDADHILLAMDQYLFGMQLSVSLQDYMFEPLITFSTISYATYYFFPPVLAILIYAKGKYEVFRKLSAAMFLSFFIGYIGYIIAPAIGPRYVISESFTNEIGGSELSQTIRQKLDDWEYTKRDCFPSLHNAAILVAVLFAFRYERKFAWIFLPFAVGLFWATVYLRYHYLVDVIAGWLLAVLCYFWGQQIYRWWEKKPHHS
ncbi:MAG: phosphatase PAP2 family protein, partial [candidate division Zixibacteria bacterium]|nr:phosphatase PAP2 family protein [candidate division Zixibacteria bacterium]